MSGWGRRGGAHLLLGGASVPLATCGQGGVQGPFLQSLRLGGGLGTWSWHVRLGTLGVLEVGSPEQGKVRHSEGEEGVCLRCVYWQGWLTNWGRQGTPIPVCTSPALALAGAPCCPPGFQNLLCHQLTQKRPWA